MKRKLCTLALLFCLAASLLAAADTRVFIDDLGRKVTVPADIQSIAPAGSTAQVILLTFNRSKLSGLTTSMSTEERALYPGLGENLPVLGTFYGKRANLNLESVILADPDVVLDIGEIKGSVQEMINDLDNLQKQIGIPVVFIESYLSGTASTYTRLGDLMGDDERGSELAAYAEEAVAFGQEVNDKLGGIITFYYSSAIDGLDGIPQGSFHGEVLEAVGGVNVIPDTFSSGGNAISLEQLFIWDPDVVILSNPQAYQEATTSRLWESLSAVQNGRVYLVPNIINNWIDSPPSINRLVGIFWAAATLYGEDANVDLRKEAREYYSLFYNYSVSDSEFEAYSI